METILQMSKINKSFPGVKALDDVSFEVRKGEIMGLAGENGAGKSTLIKVLSGAYKANSGTITIMGETLQPGDVTPQRMIDKGVAVIYQEFMLEQNMSVAENVYLGQFPRRKFGFVDFAGMERKTTEIFRQLDLSIDPKTKICDLSVAKCQMVEIAKALSRNAQLIVLDEPTAVLGENELQGLFRLMRKLSSEGISFIYISHRLNEVFEITDRITVMKDGMTVVTDDTANFTGNRLVHCMIGRELKDIYPEKDRVPGDVVLRASHYSRAGKLNDISLELRQGEILGVSGLVGAGRTELLRAIVGADPVDSGEAEVYGKPVKIRRVRDAIGMGIGFLTEDRKLQGLLLKQTTCFNISVTNLKKARKYGLIRPSAEKKTALELMKQINVRPGDPGMCVQNLSGGNQQKVVLCKWLNANCKILLIDEPTRGVDIGAKQEIYGLLAALAKKGMGILMVSSELPEILGMSDRVIVMHEGDKVAELVPEETDEEEIMMYATGQKQMDQAV